jgi:hypothetical protein
MKRSAFFLSHLTGLLFIDRRKDSNHLPPECALPRSLISTPFPLWEDAPPPFEGYSPLAYPKGGC